MFVNGFMLKCRQRGSHLTYGYGGAEFPVLSLRWLLPSPKSILPAR